MRWMRITTAQAEALPPFDVARMAEAFRWAAASAAAIGLDFDPFEAACRVFAPHHVEPALERLSVYGVAPRSR